MKINWSKVLESLAVCSGYAPALYHWNYLNAPHGRAELNHHGMTPITSAYIEQHFMPRLVASNDRNGCLDAMPSYVIERIKKEVFG